MRRIIIGLTLLTGALAVWAAPSQAQQKPFNALSDEEKAERRTAEVVDRQYKVILDRTRKETGEVRVDPWSNMRGADTSKPKR